MTRPPFSRLSREVLVDNPWHRYCRDRYVQTDGSEGVYFYVDMPGSCAVIPVFADGSTVLVQVHRYLLGRDLFEFPIGGMRLGEEPLAVAQKELHEEAGLTAARWTPLGAFAPYKGASNELCHFFLARDLREVAQELEPSERITVHRLPFAEARARLLEQEVGDGQSMAGLLLLERWLGRGNTLRPPLPTGPRPGASASRSTRRRASASRCTTRRPPRRSAVRSPPRASTWCGAVAASD